MTDSCYPALQEQCSFRCIIANFPAMNLFSCTSAVLIHCCLTFIVIVECLWLIPLGFQLRHPCLRSFKSFSVDAHQLKKPNPSMSVIGVLETWEDNGDTVNHSSYLIDFAGCHDQCRRHHDGVTGNSNQHAALLALLPKDRTNAWKSIIRQYTDFSFRRFRLRFGLV